MPFGHDGVRLLTLVALGVSAVLAGLCVLGLTHRPFLAVLGGSLFGSKLVTPFSNEPGHPQIVITVLLAALATVVVRWDSKRPVAMSLIVGTLVGALAMTKINVGVFAALATSLAILLAGGKPGRMTGLLRNGLILAMLLLPLVLIRSRLMTGIGVAQACHYMAPMIAVLLTALAGPTRNPGSRKWLVALACYVLAVIAVSAALCAFALAHGTTAHGLLSGTIVMPARMAAVWGGGPQVTVGMELVASLTLACVYAYRGRRGLPIPEAATAALKLIFAASVLGALVPIDVRYRFIGWGLFLWVFLLRLPGREVMSERDGEASGFDPRRVSLALLAVLQPLQSYPVAGSQVAIGTMLMIPAAITCLWDVSEWLGRHRFATAILRRLEAMAAVAVIAVVALWAYRDESRYARSIPLRLPGSSRIRLEEREVAVIRWLVANIDRSCSTFLCPTGYYSLYLWTEKEPPSRVVLAHVVEIFTKEQQQVLLDSIEAAPRPLIVDHPSNFPAPEGPRVPGQRILLDGIDRDFVAYGGGSVENFTLKVKRGHPIPELVECAHWVEEGPIRTASLDLLAKPGHAAYRVSIAEIGGKPSFGTPPPPPDRVLADSQADGPARALDVFDESGERANLPLDLAGRRKLTLRFPHVAGPSEGTLAVVRLIDRDGGLITSVPFVTPFGSDTYESAK